MTQQEVQATFYDRHADAIRQATARVLQQQPEQDTGLLVMREFLRVDPLTGQAREVPLSRIEMIRLYFQFLRDNERLPPRTQLKLEEIRLVWETLLAFFGEDEVGQDRIGQVFKLVQRKMEQGFIGQAWIVLNIFDYQRSVRVDNERNLFLEEMALLFARRQPEAGRQVTPDLRRLLQEAADDLSLLPDVLKRLESDLDLRLHLLLSDHAEQEAWAAVWPAGPASGVASPPPLPREAGDDEVRADAPTLPPVGRAGVPQQLLSRKWRNPGPWRPDQEGAPLADLLSDESVRHYLDSLLKGVYFLILVTESTGFEPFLVEFVGWLRAQTGEESMRSFSLFHAQVTLEERTVNETLDMLLDTEPLSVLPPRLAALDPAVIVTATREWLRTCAAADLDRIAPGDYSLAGLILDRAIGLTFSEPELSFRMHRLL